MTAYGCRFPAWLTPGVESGRGRGLGGGCVKSGTRQRHPRTEAISRVVDVSDSQEHIVRDRLPRQLFFGNLGTFQIGPGTEEVFKLIPSGDLNSALPMRKILVQPACLR